MIEPKKWEVENRFQGPPHSGNGGYVCGRLASGIEGVVEVTLRKPCPLDKGLQVSHARQPLRDFGKKLEDSPVEESVRLFDGDVLIAEARPSSLSIDVPAPPSWDESVVLSRSYVGFAHHAFPGCFVCGPDRKEHDGLCLYPGKDTKRGLVAAPWRPSPSLLDENDEEGRVQLVYMWAAMDCPGAFAVGFGEDRLLVLGRLTAEVIKRVTVGEECVAIGWPIAENGRKFEAGTAIFDASGALCGRAKATWFEISASAFGAIANPGTN